MTRHSLPPIDPNDLSDQADPDRVDRIWNRLAPELQAADRAAETKTPSRHVWLIAAALAGTFGGGIWVGHSRSARDTKDDGSSVAVAAPDSAPDLLAAGSTSRSFPLTNGGKLLLQPESLVEVADRSEAGMTLRLLRGSASIDATHAVGGPISIVAGEARLTAPAGGSVEVTRHERDLDVTVSGGSVDIQSPNGHQVVPVGQRALAVPIITATAVRGDVVTPHRAEVTPPPTREPLKVATNDEPQPRATSQPNEPPTVAAVPASASWMNKLDHDDLKEAARLLDEQGGVRAAIQSTHNPNELVKLGDMASFMGQPGLRWVAIQRLVDEFPGDPNAPTLALVLSNHFRDDLKNPALADKYNGLAQRGRLAEDAVCEQLKHGEASNATIVEAAKEYESRYPQGYCKDVAGQILADAAEQPHHPPPDGASTSDPKGEEPKDSKKDDAKDAPKKDAKDAAKADDSAHPAPSSSAKAAPKPAVRPSESAKAPPAKD